MHRRIFDVSMSYKRVGGGKGGVRHKPAGGLGGGRMRKDGEGGRQRGRGGRERERMGKKDSPIIDFLFIRVGLCR